MPCPHLSGHHCTIHNDLAKKGFSGCARYDCAGAGQRATALFNGESWQHNPADLPCQMETFRHLRQLHDLLQMLIAAGALPLPLEVERQRLRHLQQLCPDPMTPALARTLATGPLPQAVREFLTSLAPHAARRPA